MGHTVYVCHVLLDGGALEKQIFTTIHYLFLCVRVPHMRTYMPRSTRVGRRATFWESILSFSPVLPGDQIQATGLGAFTY